MAAKQKPLTPASCPSRTILKVELICQSNDPSLWRPLSYLLDDLKQATGVPIDFDDDQRKLRGEIPKPS